MEFEAPVKLPNNAYKVQINTAQPFIMEYLLEETGTHSFPTDTCDEYRQVCAAIAREYEDYSAKWFGSRVLPVTFLQRLSHSWNFGKHPLSPATSSAVRQGWCPDHIQLLPTTNKIHWRLESVKYLGSEVHQPSGPQELDTNDIPLQEAREPVAIDSSPRSRAIRKVRMARLLAAVSKARVARLTKRFYERYGSLEVSVDDPILSSESEDEKESDGLRIKI